MNNENNKLKIALFFYISFIVLSPCLAQKVSGVKFETGLSFRQIKEKAKNEDKYIFVDTYTSWCIPCKKMEAEIFPLKEVGEFFNRNFINYKVQIDTTKTDNYLVRNAYNDARLIKETYQISAYPTYLVLNAEGTLLHRVIGGASTAQQFITKFQKALDSANQGVNLVKQFENGRRDSSFLKLMIEYSTTSDYKNRALYVQCFLKTQNNLLTAQNIRYILQSVATSKDIGYDILINHPKEVIAVVGERWRNDVINDIIFDEHILPKLRYGGKKQTLQGGMYIYVGEINKNVDWGELRDLIAHKFKDRSDRLLLNAKLIYYRWNEDWENLNKTLLAYTSKKTVAQQEIVSHQLQDFVNFCKEKEYLKDVLRWAYAAQFNEKAQQDVKNYALVLYKTGLKKKAINTMVRLRRLLPKPDEDTEKLILKMEKNEPID